MEPSTPSSEPSTAPAPTASQSEGGPRPNAFAVKAKAGFSVGATWWEGVLLQNAFQIIQGRYDL